MLTRGVKFLEHASGGLPGGIGSGEVALRQVCCHLSAGAAAVLLRPLDQHALHRREE